MKCSRLVGMVLGSSVCMLGAVDAQAWHQVDDTCHVYLAWPYATNCSRVAGAGYAIQRAKSPGVWENDPLGGRGRALSLSKNGNLWTIPEDSSVWQRTGTWQAGTWTSKPRNICGTGAPITFNQTGNVQVLAVATDSSNRDVPWVIDADGVVRFWRTRFSPNCWAATPAVPGEGALTNIGIYEDLNHQNEAAPWVVRGNELYVYDGSSWILLDRDTGLVQSRGAYVTSYDGLSLWTFDKHNGSWWFDPEWNATDAGKIIRITSGSDLWRTAVVTDRNRVWLNVF